jgi:hypothetical protein
VSIVLLFAFWLKFRLNKYLSIITEKERERERERKGHNLHVLKYYYYLDEG